MKTPSSRLLATLALTLGTIALPHVAQAQTVAFTPPAVGSTSFANGVTTGYTFTVGASPISVTDLGYYDVDLDGLLTSHVVSIWSSGGTLLGTGTVASGFDAPLTDNYRYATLGSPIALSANTTYTIGATNPVSPAEAIPVSLSAGAVTAVSGVSLGEAQAILGENTFPTTDFFGAGHYMTPNFKFTLASSSAPEPGTLIFLALGGTLVLVKRRRHLSRPTARVGIAAACLLSLAVPGAHAQVFLVGAELYSATSTGVNSGTDYSYSTNSNTFHARLSLTLGASTQDNAISFGLSPGANNFTFTVGPSFDPGSFAGINLLFNSTGTSFNPATTTGIPGNLTAVGSTTTLGSFFVPLSGTLVRTYDAGTGTAPATGATSFAVGGRTVTVTAMTVNNVPSGSFTLSVSGASAPEPTSLALIALCGLPSMALRSRGSRRPR